MCITWSQTLRAATAPSCLSESCKHSSPKVSGWSKGDNEIHGQQMQVNPALDTCLIKLMFQPEERSCFSPGYCTCQTWIPSCQVTECCHLFFFLFPSPSFWLRSLPSEAMKALILQMQENPDMLGSREDLLITFFQHFSVFCSGLGSSRSPQLHFYVDNQH